MVPWFGCTFNPYLSTMRVRSVEFYNGLVVFEGVWVRMDIHTYKSVCVFTCAYSNA